jgi:hypothetical protein
MTHGPPVAIPKTVQDRKSHKHPPLIIPRNHTDSASKEKDLAKTPKAFLSRQAVAADGATIKNHNKLLMAPNTPQSSRPKDFVGRNLKTYNNSTTPERVTTQEKPMNLAPVKTLSRQPNIVALRRPSNTNNSGNTTIGQSGT